jgi:AraC-like DNA-binding protein
VTCQRRRGHPHRLAVGTVSQNGFVPSEPRSPAREYTEWPARLSPRDSVACIWARPSAAGSGRVLPDACIDIVWDGCSLVVAGPDTGPVAVVRRPGLAFAGLRFRPGRAPAFLGVPARDLLDSRVDLADLWGRDRADRLADRLAAAPDPDAAARILDGAVADLADRAGGPDPMIDGLVSLLRRQQGSPGAVRAASQSLSVEQRRLHRHCLAAVGYGPKTLDRVLRFQRALRLAPDIHSLAALAARAGYADQAHLTRESRRLAGTTPSDLFKTGSPPAS